LKRQINNAAIQIVILLISIVLVGCSDSPTPIQSAKITGNAEGISIPDSKESTIDIYLDMLPFGEATYFSEELGMAHITSAELLRTPDYIGNDDVDFCNTLVIETDFPGDTESADCSIQEIKASWINVKNTGKKRIKLIAHIKGETYSGDPESLATERQTIGMP